jgi:hypothetical protein
MNELVEIDDNASVSGGTEISLLDILDHVLNSGVVIHGSLVISLAGVDLVYLGLNVILTSIEAALRNMDAGPGDRHLNRRARQVL